MAFLGDTAAQVVLGPGRPRRWDHLAPFVERWFVDPLRPDLDAAFARLAEIEAEHGPFSEAIREWFVLTHGRQGSETGVTYVPASDRVFVWKGRRFCVFGEVQDLFSYTVSMDDHAVEDPLVYADSELVPTGRTASEVIWLGLLYDLAQTVSLLNGPRYLDASFSPQRREICSFRGPGLSPDTLKTVMRPIAAPLRPFDRFMCHENGLLENVSHGEYTLSAFGDRRCLTISVFSPEISGWSWSIALDKEELRELASGLGQV